MLTFIGNQKTNELQLRLSELERSKHLWAWGDTCAGKSQLMHDLVLQDIRQGRSVVVFDSGDHQGFLQQVAETAEQCGRGNELFVVGEKLGALSDKIDPLNSEFTPTQMVRHLMGLYRDQISAPYGAYARSILFRLIIVAHKLLAPEKALAPIDVLGSLDLQRLAQLGERVIDLPDSMARAIILDAARELEQLDSDRLSQIVVQAQQKLQEWVLAAGELVQPGNGNPFFARIAERKSGILAVHSGDALDHGATARMVFNMLVSSLHEAFVSKKNIKPPICVHMDEAQRFVDLQEFLTLLLCARSSNIWLNGYCQSPAMLTERMGEEKAQKVALPNLGNHLFFKSTQEQTVKLATSLRFDEVPQQQVAVELNSLGSGEFFLQDGTRWNIAAPAQKRAKESL